MVNTGVKTILATIGLFAVITPVAYSQAATEATAVDAPVESTPGNVIAKVPGVKSLESVGCAGSYSMKCADCRNIAICAGGKNPTSIQSCATFNPAAPYCVNERCSSTISPDSGVCGAEFRCSSEGYFPHPDDCSKYFFCDKVNGDAYEYSCGENRVYLSRQKSCVNRTNETVCDTINCRESSNAFVQYGPHLAYYAFCAETNGRKETIIYKCPDEATSEFDLDTLSCVYRCPGEGRYINPSNCSTFYECYPSGMAYQAIKWACPQGFSYNEELQRCEVGPCSPK